MSSPDYNYSIFKTIYPTKSIDGSYDNKGTMSVPSRTLLSHFGGCKYLFFFGFWTEGDWSQNRYYGNNTKSVICFFCDVYLWCQVSRTLL